MLILFDGLAIQTGIIDLVTRHLPISLTTLLINRHSDSLQGGQDTKFDFSLG